MSDTAENELRNEVKTLSALVEELAGRVTALESIVQTDHRLIEQDHHRIENLETTGKVRISPVVGL